MTSLAIRALSPIVICLLFFILQSSALFSQSSDQAVFHFGESPCGESFKSNPKAQDEISRKITKRTFPKMIEGVEGDLVIAIAINKSGKVIYAEYLPDRSTVKDKQAIMSAIETIIKTTFAEDPYASDSECGLWTMQFKDM